MRRTWLIGMVRAPPASRLTVISAGEVAATVPTARVPSRITTVACGKSAVAAAGEAGSCLAQEEKKRTAAKSPNAAKSFCMAFISVWQRQYKPRIHLFPTIAATRPVQLREEENREPQSRAVAGATTWHRILRCAL